MNAVIDGVVYKVLEKQTFASGFVKQTLIVKTATEYPQCISIDFVKDKTDLLNSLKVGESVAVDVNIRGQEYKEKFYVSLNGWKISKGEKQVKSDDGLPF